MGQQLDLLDAIDESIECALVDRLRSENANILPGQYWQVVYHRFYAPGFPGNSIRWLLGEDDKGFDVWTDDRDAAKRFTWVTASKHAGRGNGVTIERYNNPFPGKQ